jgi:hypothetical protein
LDQYLTLLTRVKLFSGSISHENEENLSRHAWAVFTLTFTVMTVVLQIVCLNRGFTGYTSTLVVSVFYGVYTAARYVYRLSWYTKWQADEETSVS